MHKKFQIHFKHQIQIVQTLKTVLDVYSKFIFRCSYSTLCICHKDCQCESHEGCKPEATNPKMQLILVTKPQTSLKLTRAILVKSITSDGDILIMGKIIHLDFR
jgi:hypothetical protein